MKRSYYQDNVINFLKDTNEKILGTLVRNNEFELEGNQKWAWAKQIEILKRVLGIINDGFIAFEYTIPRMGKRIDNVFIYKGIVFLLEFKVGSEDYYRHDIDQVYDYGLDLKNFHEESLDRYVVPILISTDGDERPLDLYINKDMLFKPICCNEFNLVHAIKEISGKYGFEDGEYLGWMESRYRPTPTIIEAAQALYRGHNVKEISRSDAGAKNLSETTGYINKVIDYSKNNGKKTICFLTGVPGSGKTLAGLNIGASRQKYEEDEHTVFLSGNGPLVSVLREALARDDNESNGTPLNEAKRRASVFIQNIHHFRDAAIKDDRAPIEKVAIFDEAQRAWNKKQTERFMRDRGIELGKSEPQFLISVMDRHKDWACIVCLVGGGQEIHRGEAGLREWFKSINQFKDWEVHLSDRIADPEYLELNSLSEVKLDCKYTFTDRLHLSTSIRSFRSERLSDFVKTLLDMQVDECKRIYDGLRDKYPLYLTRNLDMAKRFLKESSRGNERYGIVASSDARRLKAEGLDVKSGIEVEHWFLKGKDDVRSSFYLEDIATEFDIQGLELDWICVAWGGDFRYTDTGWEYKNFKGTRWQSINREDQRLYKKNSYRVLLTRARQGMVIYVPVGDLGDHTRNPEYYNGTYNYLKNIGIEELNERYFDELGGRGKEIAMPDYLEKGEKEKAGNKNNKKPDIPKGGGRGLVAETMEKEMYSANNRPKNS
ncbi:MAG: DUF2075 domain-containing protein [Natronincolaceae bacterium]|nr:DUF2075 domain-containing protein [Bacillota bacterium]